MAKFEVKITRIRAIEPIEGADAIELAVIGDYRSVVRKGQYDAGDLAAYIPEAALLPEILITAMGLEGRLAGSHKNRVKAVKLRGCLSQGLLYPVGDDGVRAMIRMPGGDPLAFMILDEGDDVAELLGITKYEPPIPINMAGEVYNAGQHLTVAYDVENIKKFPDVLVDGEEVVMTEKLHGTFTGVGILPKADWDEKHYRGKFVVFSKGLGADGLCFKHNDNNAGNLYVRTLEALGVFAKIEAEFDGSGAAPVFILGETFGVGVQDLTYGVTQPTFRVFDIAIGYRGDQKYVDYDFMVAHSERMNLKTVPLVYRGPYSKQALLEHTGGKETFSGKEANIREGVVVKPTEERSFPELGRVALKSVSEAYLLRKNANATEFS